MYQVALMHSNRDVFMAELNEHLSKGLRVVPGSFYCGSQQLVGLDRTPEWFKLPDGSTFFKVFFVVLELDDELVS
ncbi:MAG: hypothetical protein U0836_16335 [Pirellulales bacterium]